MGLSPADELPGAVATGPGAPRRVLLFSRIDFAWLYPTVMARLRARCGTRFIVVIGHDKWRGHYAASCGPGDRIIVAREIDDEARAMAGVTEDAFARAAANEDWLGVTYLRDIVQQARGVSAQYLQYAPHSPYSRMGRLSWPDIARRINGYVAYFAALLEREGVDLVIERPGDLMSTACLHVACARGVATTFALPSRHLSYAMWSYGPYLGDRLLRQAYEDRADVGPAPVEAPQAPHDSRRNFERAADLASLRRLLSDGAHAVVDHAIWRWRDLRAGRRSVRLPLTANLRHMAARWHAHRRLEGMVESSLERLCARPFILFLLQYEPEYTTLSLAREFNDTRAVVQQLALALPAGVNLVLKENVNSIGNRRLSFYEDLRRLPNVVLADHRIPGVELAAHARAVATISSTGAIEANLLGKPAVIFARNVEYGFLPHVHVCTDLGTLPGLMRAVLRPRSKAEADEIRRSGARYRRALAELSFDAPDTRPFRGTATEIADDQVERAVDLLVETYRAQVTA